jgi:membrane protein
MGARSLPRERERRLCLRAASSLITLLLWVYYSSQILLFGAEFTEVYACQAGRGVAPDEHAIRVETKEVRSRG